MFKWILVLMLGVVIGAESVHVFAHKDMDHSNPSTFITVGILNIFVIIPNGPFAELTTRIKSVFEKQA